MLQATIIGHLGADAQVKNNNAKQFTTFRIAHTDKWTDEAGTVHANTMWVDCIINGVSSVVQYLKKGQLVYLTGSVSLRVYSSAKDKCMKAGMTINVRQVELLAGKADEVPSVLYDANDGERVDVQKLYHASSLVRTEDETELYPLVSKTGDRFVCNRSGFIYPFKGKD